MKKWMIACSAVALLGAGAFADTTSLSSGDRHRLHEAARLEMVEINSAQIALKRSRDGIVRDYAKQVLLEHQQELTDLRTLASAHGETLPDHPNRALRDDYNTLNGKRGSFERAYLHEEIKHHKKMADMFQAASKSDNSDVANFFSTHLAHIQAHLDRAQTIAADER